MNEIKTARKYAFKLLASSQKSSHELAMRLKQKNYSEEIIKAIMKELEAHNYIDDNEYSDDYIRKRYSSGYGEKAIRQGLFEKGFSEKEINEYIGDYLKSNNVNEAEIAELAVKNKYGKTGMKKQKMVYSRIRLFLENRGFSDDVIANWSQPSQSGSD
jgi:SOS response regulatory protein OraA/RecX